MKFKHHCGITDCGMCGKDCLKQSDSLIMKRKIEVLFVLSMYYEFGKHYLIQTCMKRFIWGKTNEKCQHLVNTFGSLIYPCQRKTSLFFLHQTRYFLIGKGMPEGSKFDRLKSEPLIKNSQRKTFYLHSVKL